MTLVLETLGRDETLDAGGFGVGFLSFAFGLDFTADDEFADLESEGERVSPSADRRIPTSYHQGSHKEDWPSICLPERCAALTSSSLVKSKSLRILVARFGPNRFGLTVSVTPSNSCSPFFTMLNASTLRSMPTIHPLTLFLLRSPVRRGR